MNRPTRLAASIARPATWPRRRHVAAWLAALVCAAAAATGCGVRTAPKPPEDTAARAPERFEAEARGDSVTISWGRPTKALDGSRLYDLSKFVLERSTNGGSFVPVTTIDVTDQDRIRPQRTFRYRDPAPPGVYEYRVHAVTADGEPGITTAPLRIEVPAAEAAP